MVVVVVVGTVSSRDYDIFIQKFPLEKKTISCLFHTSKLLEVIKLEKKDELN